MVTRYEESRWYRGYQRSFAVIAVVGGVAMLLGAAVAHEAAGIPLLVIGGGWTAMGAAGAAQRRTVFRWAEFENGILTLGSTLKGPRTRS